MADFLNEILDFMKRQNRLVTNLGPVVEDNSVYYTCIREKVRQQLELVNKAQGKNKFQKKQPEILPQSKRPLLKRSSRNVDKTQMAQEKLVFLRMKCELCKEEFRDQKLLEEHLKAHNKNVLFKCKLCLKIYLSIDPLKIHMLQHVNENGRNNKHKEARKNDSGLKVRVNSTKHKIKEFKGNEFDQQRHEFQQPNINKRPQPSPAQTLAPVRQKYISPFQQSQPDQNNPGSNRPATYSPNKPSSVQPQAEIDQQHPDPVQQHPDPVQQPEPEQHDLKNQQIGSPSNEEDMQLEDGEVLLTLSHVSLNPQNKSFENVDIEKHEDNSEAMDLDKDGTSVFETVDVPYKCEICVKTYVKNSYLLRHIVLKHKRKHLCTYKNCKRKFKRRHQLRLHLKTHAKRKLHSCIFCKNLFRSKSELQNHMNTVHKKYVCLNRKCNLEFDDEKVLKEHSLVHKSRAMLHCNLCSKSFEDRNELKSHIAENHDIGTTYSCKHSGCPKVFVKPAALEEHMGSHAGDETKDEVNQHQEIHDKKVSKKQLLNCESCKKSFQQSSQLKIHTASCKSSRAQTRQQTANKEFVCVKPSCNNSFDNAAMLKQHIIDAHTNEKIFQCPSCPRIYKIKDALREHIILVHLQARHQCPYENCGKQFAMKRLADNHIINCPHGKKEETLKKEIS